MAAIALARRGAVPGLLPAAPAARPSSLLTGAPCSAASQAAGRMLWFTWKRFAGS